MRWIQATGFLMVALTSMFPGGCARDAGSDVAVVDRMRITADQFRERYQKYLSSSSMKDNIQVRKQVLENMINEVVIFEDLRSRGAESDSAFRKEMDLIRRQAIVDGYARRVTTDTMTVTQQQLALEFRRYNTHVSARYLYAPTEPGAWTLRKRLLKGETFEQLARETFKDPGLANNGGSLGTFGWGEMEDALEEAAYTLSPRELSEPVKLSMGYAVIRVDSRTVANPLASESDYAKVRGKLIEAIVKRTSPRLLRDHVLEISRAMDPQFDETTVGYVVEEWKSLIGEDQVSPLRESAQLPAPDLRGRNLVRLDGAWWTVGTLLEKLADTKERQRRRVRSAEDLKDVILGVAARDKIYDRAMKAHVDEDARVTDQMQNLGGEFRLRYWSGLVQDTVGQHGWPDTLLQRVYKQNSENYVDPPMVNVAEVLVRNEKEAKEIAQLARRGADFAALARSKSIRLWAAKRGGELGFNSKAGYGVMGEKFFGARKGGIVGPAGVDPYWAVFKIVERREGRVRSFAESKEQILAQVKQAKRQEAFQSALSALRGRANVQMNVVNLGNIVVHSETK